MKTYLTEAVAMAMGFVTRFAPRVLVPLWAVLSRVLMLLGPFGSDVATFFGALLSPLVKYVAIAVVIAVVVGGAYIKGRQDEHTADIVKINTEATDAVAKADTARSKADAKFKSGKFTNKPSIIPGRVRHGTDGYARD